MEFLERIENQIAATGLPLVGITVAAVPCPDTPVILTLHWHGFIREKLAEAPGAATSTPSARGGSTCSAIATRASTRRSPSSWGGSST